MEAASFSAKSLSCLIFSVLCVPFCRSSSFLVESSLFFSFCLPRSVSSSEIRLASSVAAAMSVSMSMDLSVTFCPSSVILAFPWRMFLPSAGLRWRPYLHRLLGV
ncbi:uncharacterized protein K452DRAFT_56037 [Aplosporella prunicola CBS 121167]|uniref:REJ domain-containing protein n=1 Tax=Aplosporella prunicola CBS 121167 TaxID=1176127 RepID=A0A6A6B982_9PEZI|nr:uncharacterized protein K452DRAFT_56037 [Aplosporella prunicola CBS 121167]KAF2139784.1 hypothetical protein K452DRAFT_56037 [Aplosporella prunicola CBS 121167]